MVRRVAHHHLARGADVPVSMNEVSVTTAATLLVTAPSAAGSAMSSYTFQNTDATVSCYISDSPTVSATRRFLLKASAAFSLDLAPGDKVYAWTLAGTTAVDVCAEVPA